MWTSIAVVPKTYHSRGEALTRTFSHTQPEEQRRQQDPQRLRGLTLCRLLRCLRAVQGLVQPKLPHQNVYEPEKQL